MVIIYLLLAFPASTNYGTPTTIERFTTIESCEKTRATLSNLGSRTTFKCVPAEHTVIK